MAELPFGDNPFAAKTTPSASVVVEKALHIIPPVSRAPLTNTQRHRKRNNQAINNDPGKGKASKKGKATTTEASSVASQIIGDLAKDNFKDEDIIGWSKRGRTEACFFLKQALDEAFFHGLDFLNSLEGENLNFSSLLPTPKPHLITTRAC